MTAFDVVAMNACTVFKALSHLLHLDFYRETRPKTIDKVSAEQAPNAWKSGQRPSCCMKLRESHEALLIDFQGLQAGQCSVCWILAPQID